MLIGLYQKSGEKTELISTEIGYLYGSIYTSMSGAYEKNHSGFGNVAMYAWIYHLKKLGITKWDMGMHMNYKIQLGGQMIPRNEFVKLVKETKDDLQISEI